MSEDFIKTNKGKDQEINAFFDYDNRYKEEITEEKKGTIKELLFPDKDGDRVLSMTVRIWRFLVPDFKWKSFTFFFSIFWLIWNTIVFVGYLVNKNSKSFTEKDYSMQCILVKYKIGSMVPFQSFNHEYWRPFVSILTCDNYYTVILGFICFWMHGFNFERMYKPIPLIGTIYFGTMIGVFDGDYYAVNDVRAQGSCLIISFLMLKGILVWDQYRHSKSSCALLLSIVSIKAIIILALTILDITKTGDWVANLWAAIGGIQFSLTWQKRLERK